MLLELTAPQHRPASLDALSGTRRAFRSRSLTCVLDWSDVCNFVMQTGTTPVPGPPSKDVTPPSVALDRNEMPLPAQAFLTS